MKKMMTLAAVAILMVACNNETEGLENTSKYITVEANMAGESRVVAKDAFADNDKIRVYAWTGSATTLPETYVVNSTNTKNANSWTASPQMLWQDGTTKHYFLSIYPDRDITNTDYTLGEELLIATNFGTDNAGVTPTSSPVSLAFDRVLSKLCVNLNFRSQWDETPEVTKVEATAKKTATVTFLTKTVTAKENEAADVIALDAQTTAATDYDLSYESLMIPQEFTGVTITIDGQEFKYTGNATLASGKVTTLNLNVGRDKVTLASAITINGWGNNGEPITGEAQ